MVTEQKPQLSVIAPVHNGGQEVAVRLGRLADDLRRIVAGPFEVVVVDDGSDAETGRVIEALAEQRADFHAVHHPRQLGFELAGQTGLERARADLVFICEDDRPVRTADLQQLWRMAEDPSVVAARAESHPLPASRSFVQRFQQLAGHHRLRDAATGASSPATIQLLRRPSLEALRRDGDLEIEHQCFRSETAVG